MNGPYRSLRVSCSFPDGFVPTEAQRLAWNTQIAEYLDAKLMGTRDHVADRAERRTRAKASPIGLGYTELSPGCTAYESIPAGKQLRGWGAVINGQKSYKTTYV